MSVTTFDQSVQNKNNNTAYGFDSAYCVLSLKVSHANVRSRLYSHRAFCFGVKWQEMLAGEVRNWWNSCTSCSPVTRAGVRRTITNLWRDSAPILPPDNRKYLAPSTACIVVGAHPQASSPSHHSVYLVLKLINSLYKIKIFDISKQKIICIICVI